MQKKKKQKLNYEKSFNSNNDEILRIIKILVGVILFLVLFYFLAMLMTGEIKFGNKNQNQQEDIVIQYDEILAGETFKKSDLEYYVLYFNFSEDISSTYLAYRSSYLEKSEKFPMYMVDLEKGFNASYVQGIGEEDEQYPETIDDLKVSNPTILKIKDKKVVERIEGKDSVKEFLKAISSEEN